MSNLFKKTTRHLLNKLAYYTNSSFAKPELFYLKLTNQCNFHCQHCDIWKNKKTKDLSLDEWDKIIKNIASFCHEVTISGGEPLLYQHFWEIIALLQKHDIKINLNTNGSLITEEIAKKNFENNFNKVEISLYSLSKIKHNQFRNTDFAFDNTLIGIQNLLKHRNNSKTKIIIAYLLNQKNLDETIALIKKFSEKNIWVTIQALDSNIQPMKSRIDFQEKNPSLTANDLWPKDHQKINQLFDELIKMKQTNFLIYNRKNALNKLRQYYLANFAEIKKLPCLCGQNNFIIGSNGDVFFCFDGPTIGNLLQSKGKIIWQSKKAKEVRKQIKHCREVCRIMNCNYNDNLFAKITEYLKKYL